MSVENWISLLEMLGIWAGSLLVILQLRDGNDQRKLESALQIYGINREIIALGFTTPELFRVLHGKVADPLVERHYLQLWFNQFALIFNFQQRRFFPADLRESLNHDISYFMEEENARNHWKQNRQYYPAAFQAFIDRLTPLKADALEERPPEEAKPLTK